MAYLSNQSNLLTHLPNRSFEIVKEPRIIRSVYVLQVPQTTLPDVAMWAVVTQPPRARWLNRSEVV